jgi:hypothetical protein
MKWSWLVLLLVMLPGLWACSTGGVTLEDQGYSLVDIRRAITKNIGEPRAISQNQRTFTSVYFSPKPDKKFDPHKSKQRAYAKIVVLGDRRPYDIECTVIVEERDSDGDYSEIGEDPSQSEQLAENIKKKLHQSSDELNVIDDFRAF